MRSIRAIIIFASGFLVACNALADAEPPPLCGATLSGPAGDLDAAFVMRRWGTAEPTSGRKQYEVWTGKLRSQKLCEAVVPEPGNQQFRGFDTRVSIRDGRIRAFEYRAASSDCAKVQQRLRDIYSPITPERVDNVGPRQAVEWPLPSGIVVAVSFYKKEQSCWISAYFDPV